MKVSVVAVLVLAAFLQANARWIGFTQNEGMSKDQMEIMVQTYECTREIGLGPSDIPVSRPMEPMPEDNEKVKKLVGCVFVKKEIINHDNEVNEGKLHSFVEYLCTKHGVPQAKVDEITAACKTVGAADYNLKSLRIQNCLNEKLTSGN